MRKLIGAISVLLLFLITAPAQIQTQAEPELSPLDVVQLDVDLVATDLATDAVELARYDAGDRPQPIGTELETSVAHTERAIDGRAPDYRSPARYNARE
jgi:hypothetical protein